MGRRGCGETDREASLMESELCSPDTPYLGMSSFTVVGRANSPHLSLVLMAGLIKNWRKTDKLEKKKF